MTVYFKIFFQKFISNQKHYPILTAVASGLYPLLFYITNNYTIANSIGHLKYFLFNFIILPVILFTAIYYIFKLQGLRRYKKYPLPFLNIFFFIFYMTICYYAGIHKKWLLLGIFLAILFSIFLNKYLNKVVVIQFILAIISLLSFAQNNYAVSNKWKNLPDDILNINFKKKPNIYFIQPDGYVNFSELKGENYNTDFTDFENYLADNGFTYYYDFRSNYYSTLSSNSATFNMKHHYYNDKPQLSEVLNARNNIVSENAVLSIFKQNGYSTHFISELPYLLLNKTKLGFDTSNFIDDEISYISKGLGKPVDILNPLKKEFFNKSDLSKFFFIEFFNPGHITANKRYSKGKELEKKEWLESLKIANFKLKNLIDFIIEMDASALIIIMADHGGFVGLNSTSQSFEKLDNRDLIYSIFSTKLAIKWPKGTNYKYINELKSNVNLFRIIFSYLSGNQKYLNSMEKDESFIIIKKGAPKGIYKYIDNQGKITFEKR